jgi:superfamily II DNA or RNA helicase
MEVKEISREEVQLKALHKALEYERGTLAISMGVGKTRIALYHMEKLFDAFTRVLVVVPKWSVKDSWVNEINLMSKQALLDHIEFTTYLSLNKKRANDYDTVYLDECHSLLESHEEFLDQFRGRILGLTGTPPKSGEKLKMVNRYCPVRYTFSVDDAADNDILNDYQIIVHELELSKVKNVKKSAKDGRTWYTSELADYQYYTGALGDAQTPKQRQFLSIMRMKAMMDYPTKEAYAKGLMRNIGDQCIVFANTQKQADRMCDHSYHSKNPDSEDNLQLFSDGRIDKLSCVLQLSEGVTIPNLKQGIIMHAYGNERKSAQRIGRLLRLNPTETATCHILCYKNTQDVKWVNSALSTFDQTKVKFYNPLNK